MRAFVEEAAGISRYKERRKETEARIADTRENLERLQDVRDEVEKQIRHLQRQAATARRYQALKEQERRLTAELLALRLRELDSGARGARCGGARARARHAGRAWPSSARRRRRSRSSAPCTPSTSERAGGRAGALLRGRRGHLAPRAVDRAHARAARAPARRSRPGAHDARAELAAHIERDEQQLAAVRAELARSSPRSSQAAQQAESERRARELEAAERALQRLAAALGERTRARSAPPSRATQVERARIEQLENQQRRLSAQAQRLAEEHEVAERAAPGRRSSARLGCRTGARARAPVRSLRATLARCAASACRHCAPSSSPRRRQLEPARGAREAARAELTSLEALQAAALSDHAGQTGAVAAARAGLGARPRLARRSRSRPAGSARSKPCSGTTSRRCASRSWTRLAGRACEPGDRARHADRERRGAQRSCAADTLAARVRGPRGHVRAARAACLPPTRWRRRCAQRAAPRAPGESFITREGEWVGRDWLRVSRGTDQRAGVLEREHRLKGLRGAAPRRPRARVEQAEAALAAARAALGAGGDASATRRRRRCSSAHRAHADLLGRAAGRARARRRVGPARRAARSRMPARSRASAPPPQEALRARRAGARARAARRWRSSRRGTRQLTSRARARGARRSRRRAPHAQARSWRPRPARARGVAPLDRELGGGRHGTHERAARAARAPPRGARGGAGLGR